MAASPSAPSAVLCVVLLCCGLAYRGSATGVRKTGPQYLPLFVDPLPIPTQLKPSNGKLSISAYKISHSLHRDMPKVSLYAFGTSQSSATVPGPTIVAKRGESLTVTWGNQIPDQTHRLPVDYTIGAPKPKRQGVPLSVHLHGAFTQSTYDGHAEAWVTKFGDSGPAYNGPNYVYPNIQQATTLWYHDHTVGMTRLNVIMGLTGVYIIRDETVEKVLNLPSGDYDVPLLITDRSIDTKTGDLIFAGDGVNPNIHPNWIPEYFGDYFIVNGKVSPYFEVAPRKYRFRIIDSCSAKFLNLFLTRISAANKKADEPYWSPTFTVVATEQGFLPKPVTTSTLFLAPGERMEVVIDFSGLEQGTSIQLMNDAVFPYAGGDPPAGSQRSVMLFVVKNSEGKGSKDTSTVPASLVPLVKLNPAAAKRTRYITMTENINPVTGNPEYLTLEGLRFKDPVTITPRMGETEVWTIINLTVDWHPLHVHLVGHQVVQRQPFDKAKYMAKQCDIKQTYGQPGTCFMGPVELPSAVESGWKDTTKCPSDYVTTLIFYFGLTEYSKPLPFDPTVGPGYMYHCHIVDHEDNDMMRQFKIIK